jgi:hypothetical protein
MKQISQLVSKVAEQSPLHLFHSQPMPRDYSTIAVAKRLTGANQIQLAFVNAVVKTEGKA